jgi:hypothetical protein
MENDDPVMHRSVIFLCLGLESSSEDTCFLLVFNGDTMPPEDVNVLADRIDAFASVLPPLAAEAICGSLPLPVIFP